MFEDYIKLLEEKTGKKFEDLIQLPPKEFMEMLEKVAGDLTSEDFKSLRKGSSSSMDNIPVGATITITREEKGLNVQGNCKGCVITFVEMLSITLGNIINNIDKDDLKEGANLKEAKKDALEEAIETIKSNVEEID